MNRPAAAPAMLHVALDQFLEGRKAKAVVGRRQTVGEVDRIGARPRPLVAVAQFSQLLPLVGGQIGIAGWTRHGLSECCPSNRAVSIMLHCETRGAICCATLPRSKICFEEAPRIGIRTASCTRPAGCPCTRLRR